MAKAKAAPAPSLPRLNSIRASADLLAISTEQVKQLIREGHLRSVRIGKAGQRIATDELERFIEAGGVVG